MSSDEDMGESAIESGSPRPKRERSKGNRPKKNAIADLSARIQAMQEERDADARRISRLLETIKEQQKALGKYRNPVDEQGFLKVTSGPRDGSARAAGQSPVIETRNSFAALSEEEIQKKERVGNLYVASNTREVAHRLANCNLKRGDYTVT